MQLVSRGTTATLWNLRPDVPRGTFHGHLTPTFLFHVEQDGLSLVSLRCSTWNHWPCSFQYSASQSDSGRANVSGGTIAHSYFHDVDRLAQFQTWIVPRGTP